MTECSEDKQFKCLRSGSQVPTSKLTTMGLFKKTNKQTKKHVLTFLVNSGNPSLVSTAGNKDSSTCSPVSRHLYNKLEQVWVVFLDFFFFF